MTISDDEDEILANYLESEVLSADQEEEVEDEPKAKRLRVEENDKGDARSNSGKLNSISDSILQNNDNNGKMSVPRRIETGILSKLPPELFPHILKFLSSEDLVSCSLVCRFLNYAASDEYLWRRL
ncbi:hypothetical protein SLEP1_g21841 [Rubroshorea leprosula]|uniref:F-box domain-containing protein n=1 Tax=Rubroshorea leprosula TaxID=152421 RepID=A0AAV5JCR0_9ROSI|nr:hypothetical protein SLEP1_g21841 [Rubroshorea leprosula]